MKSAILLLPLLLAPLCFAQRPAEPKTERTFTLSNPASPRDLQELFTVLRTVGFIQKLNGDPATSSVTINGSAGEIALAEWIIHALDQPAATDTVSKQTRDTAVHEYILPGAKDDVVRMFYLANTTTPQNMQELLTVLRTVASIRYVFNYTALHALAVRGTAAEIAVSAWIINELDQPPNVQTEGIHQYQWSDPHAPVVRVFYLAHRTQRDLQDTLTSLRASAHIQHAFSHTARGAVVISGTAAEADEAARMVAQKDRGAPPPVAVP